MGSAVSDAAVEIWARAAMHCDSHSAPRSAIPMRQPGSQATIHRQRCSGAVQVAWPPPERQGDPWQTGLRTSDGPFDPDNPPAQLGDVSARDGAVALDRPEPDSIVLDWFFSVPRTRQTMSFPGPDQDFTVLSVPYWKRATDRQRRVLRDPAPDLHEGAAGRMDRDQLRRVLAAGAGQRRRHRPPR